MNPSTELWMRGTSKRCKVTISSRYTLSREERGGEEEQPGEIPVVDGRDPMADIAELLSPASARSQGQIISISR